MRKCYIAYPKDGFKAGVSMAKKLEIKIGDFIFEAMLLEKLAPVTCATLLKYLPHEEEGIHGRWSGYNIYVPWKIPPKEKIPPDNQTIYGSAGDVLWNTHPVFKEVFISYGVAQYRDEAGPLPANHFAKITENLEQLKNVCTQIWRKGPKKVSLRGK